MLVAQLGEIEEAILEQFPDPRLKRVSKPIETVTDEIRELAENMCEVMYDEPGIGLAAAFRLNSWPGRVPRDRRPRSLLKPETATAATTWSCSMGRKSPVSSTTFPSASFP